MTAKTEELLKVYNKEVEQLARRVYLQAKSISRELNDSKTNPEDRDRIRLHIIGLLSDTSKDPA